MNLHMTNVHISKGFVYGNNPFRVVNELKSLVRTKLSELKPGYILCLHMDSLALVSVLDDTDTCSLHT